MSGLKETFIKRYIVERTTQTEIRPEEESEKAESCQKNLWNKIQSNGPQTETDTKNRIKKKRSGQARLVYVKDISRNIPTT